MYFIWNCNGNGTFNFLLKKCKILRVVDCTIKNVISSFRHYKGISVRGFEGNLEMVIYKYIGR